MQRWYIARSSIFDCPDTVYRRGAYKEFLKTLPYISNIRQALEFGWSNSSLVVTFSMEEWTETDSNMRKLENALDEKFEEFALWGAIIYPKEW